MNRLIHLISFAALVALAVLSRPPAALARSGGPYELSWSTLDGGGSTSTSGGRYELAGTIGQSDAGRLEGGGYSLAGGFWSGGAAVEVPIPVSWTAAVLGLCLTAGLLARGTNRGLGSNRSP
jgi:hypothetical protein